MALWKDGCFVPDPWRPIADAEPVPEDGPVLVSLDRWRAERAALAGRGAPVGLVLEPGKDWDDIAADLPRFAAIAVTIPKYADGRAFSIARLLRERDSYAGEIRAVGNYVIDQVPLLRRVGVDAFQTEDPILIAQLRRGDWPEVRHYLQPAAGREVPAGTRPWQRRPADAGGAA